MARAVEDPAAEMAEIAALAATLPAGFALVDPAAMSLARRLEKQWVIEPKDPFAWVKTRLPNRHLWSKQREIIESVRDNPRTAVKSCHGVGKSYIAATVSSWWASAFPEDETLVVTTAPTAAQVGAILWEEIRRAWREGDLPGKVGGDNAWKSDNGVLIGLGRKPADHDTNAFQGLHKRRVLVVADEACGIPLQLWTAFEAVATGSNCRQLAIGNPDDPTTEFANVCKPGSGWNVVRISAFDSPNLTGEEVPDILKEVLVSKEWVEDKKTRWGEASPRYQSKVLGLFPEIGEDTLIQPAWIEAAQRADFANGVGSDGVGPVPEKEIAAALPKRPLVSADVARYGSDDTIIGVLENGRFRIKVTMPKSATTETTGRTIGVMREWGGADAVIDGSGVGGGVVDELKEEIAEDAFEGMRRPRVIDFQAAAKAKDVKKFANKRAEMWWMLRDMFEAGLVDIDELDDQLAAQLGSIKYFFNTKGQIIIESKAEMKKRGLPSPDRADTFMQCMVGAKGSGASTSNISPGALGAQVVPVGR